MSIANRPEANNTDTSHATVMLTKLSDQPTAFTFVFQLIACKPLEGSTSLAEGPCF